MSLKVETVYGASRFLQKVTEAPASVTVITADDIRKFGYRTLADVLRGARGFYISYDRFYNYVGVRGFQRAGDFNSRILVLLNGHRINENIYEGVYVESGFPVEMDLVDRIEIIRGPGSSLYGTNAFFGVINVITRRGGALNGSEVSLDGGSFGSGRARATFGKGWGKNTQLLVSGTGYSSQGLGRLYYPEFDQPETAFGILRNGHRERAANVFTSFIRGDLTVEAAGAARRKYFPALYEGAVFGNPSNYGEDTRGYATVVYNTQLRSGTTFAARLAADKYLFDGLYPYHPSEESRSEPEIEREYASGFWWSGEKYSSTVRSANTTR
jgi:iron complex outermembrane receptor protein